MYGKIIIKTATGMAQFKTNSYDAIYDYLISVGLSHEIAEDVASWASDVPCGSEYELEGAEICIEG